MPTMAAAKLPIAPVAPALVVAVAGPLVVGVEPPTVWLPPPEEPLEVPAAEGLGVVATAPELAQQFGLLLQTLPSLQQTSPALGS